MAVPVAVIIRFNGDPDDLLERFERARRKWAGAQESGYEQPLFYAAGRTKEGIAIVTAWESAQGHRAFGQGIHPHIDSVGMAAPDRIEHLRIESLGWE
jgi:heme-degrading monooxygenase HmoA